MSYTVAVAVALTHTHRNTEVMPGTGTARCIMQGFVTNRINQHVIRRFNHG